MNKDSFVTILSWMTELDLKGNELIVYAIIYGFSQDNESYFHGSITYLSKWTNTTEECVGYTLKNLVNKGLVEKISRSGKTNLYKAIKPNNSEEVTKVEVAATDTTVSRPEKTEDKYKDVVENIVLYLNKKVNARYRSSNGTTYKLIVSKLKSGYTYEDFIHVIDVKSSEWLNNPDFAKYLRPSTLFGNKFENYVNQQSGTPRIKQDYVINNNYHNNNVSGITTNFTLPDIDRSVIY